MVNVVLRCELISAASVSLLICLIGTLFQGFEMIIKPVISMLLIGTLFGFSGFIETPCSPSESNHEAEAFFKRPIEQKQEHQTKTGDFMAVKLDLSRSIVAGLAMADFARIEKAADELKKMSMESGWNVQTTPDYLKLSAEFRESTDRLQAAAASKNIDGTTLAYFEVTLNCVRCHKYIRD